MAGGSPPAITLPNTSDPARGVGTHVPAPHCVGPHGEEPLREGLANIEPPVAPTFASLMLVQRLISSGRSATSLANSTQVR
jgi:hypothetical protein